MTIMANDLREVRVCVQTSRLKQQKDPFQATYLVGGWGEV